MMMERDEHERETRIRRNAEISFKNSKLPPRMQAHANKQQKAKDDDLESTLQSEKSKLGFTFIPARARSVPDFRKL
jgi:Uncharacterised protein family UPF0564